MQIVSTFHGEFKYVTAVAREASNRSAKAKRPLRLNGHSRCEYRKPAGMSGVTRGNQPLVKTANVFKRSDQTSVKGSVTWLKLNLNKFMTVLLRCFMRYCVQVYIMSVL
jgi:hypothetical protein